MKRNKGHFLLPSTRPARPSVPPNKAFSLYQKGLSCKNVLKLYKVLLTQNSLALTHPFVLLRNASLDPEGN